jgi:hypothetical protein
MRPALISRFSSSVLHYLGAATIEASMICPPMAWNPALVPRARFAVGTFSRDARKNMQLFDYSISC